MSIVRGAPVMMLVVSGCGRASVGMPPRPAVGRIAAGAGHTCVVDAAAAVSCRGSNVDGQLGDGTITDRAMPVPVAGMEGVTAVAGGGFHTWASTAEGTLSCWGANESGQLGDGTNDARLFPTIVAGIAM